MKKLLFYYPSNKRSIQIETLLSELKKKEVQVLLLSQCEGGDLHKQLRKMGIETHSLGIRSSGAVYYIQQLFALIRFTKKHNITTVFSNLQQANLISVFAQYFVAADFICFRHHFKFHTNETRTQFHRNKNEMIGDWLINKLAKKIIVPSRGVYNGMVTVEKTSPKKISVIPYIYDFGTYGKPSVENVRTIISKHSHCLRLIMVSRLIPLKRHEIVFRIIRSLKEKGLKVHLFVLDVGPEEENLKSFIIENELENHISMLGFRRDFLDFMNASHLIIHPSLTEASNSAVKEMALMGKPAIVCSEVGDFSDYLRNKENGFLCNSVNFEKEATEILLEYYNNENELSKIGENAKKDIIDRFSTNENSINTYLSLLT